RSSDPTDAGNKIGSDRVGVAAQGELQVNFIGNDVVLGAAVDRSDGKDRRSGRVLLATDERLQSENGLGRENDGILGFVRICSVASDTANGHIDGINIRQEPAWDVAHPARL